MRRTKSSICSDSLALRIVALEEAAFKEFSDIFGPRFRAFFISKGLTVFDAEDLAVSCVSDIALKVDRYKPIEGVGFQSWVFTLARHAMIDWLRARKDTVSFDEDWPLAATEDEVEPNIKVVLSVREALAQISEEDQTIVKMRKLGVEHSYSEIGERLDIRAETVRVRYFRALRKLKSLLETDPRLSKILGRIQTPIEDRK